MFKGSTQKWWFVGLTGGLGKSAINFWWMILNMTIKLRSEQPRLTASCRGIHEYCWQNGNFRCNQNGLWFALFGLLICNPYTSKKAAFGEVRSEHAGAARSCEKLRAGKGGWRYWRCWRCEKLLALRSCEPTRHLRRGYAGKGLARGLARSRKSRCLARVSRGSRECRGLTNKVRPGYARGTRGGVSLRVSQRVLQGLARVKVSQGSRKGLARVSQSLACARLE